MMDRRVPLVLPDTCAAPTSGHDALDPQPYVVGPLGAQSAFMACRGCAAQMALYTQVVPDRRTALPEARTPRRTAPATFAGAVRVAAGWVW